MARNLWKGGRGVKPRSPPASAASAATSGLAGSASPFGAVKWLAPGDDLEARGRAGGGPCVRDRVGSGARTPRFLAADPRFETDAVRDRPEGGADGAAPSLVEPQLLVHLGVNQRREIEDPGNRQDRLRTRSAGTSGPNELQSVAMSVERDARPAEWPHATSRLPNFRWSRSAASRTSAMMSDDFDLGAEPVSGNGDRDSRARSARSPNG